MNKREDILNAWITIEQLCEGSINKKDKLLERLDTTEDDWEKFFLDFLKNKKVEKNISDKDFKMSGIILYFGIFNFQEVIKKKIQYY